jgi:hypothetical protein
MLYFLIIRKPLPILIVSYMIDEDTAGIKH